MILPTRIFPDANALHEGMCEQFMFGDPTAGDDTGLIIRGADIGLPNVTLGAESFAWEFNLKRLWMPLSRWNTMVRQYIDPWALEEWRNKIGDRMVNPKEQGIAVLRTRNVKAGGTGRGVRRRWGSCMLNMSFRLNPIPTFSFHSRTTYFGYLAAMDLTVAHCLAREVSAIIGLPVEAMQFVWTLNLAKFSGDRSLAWSLMNEEIRVGMDADLPHRSERNLFVPGYKKALNAYAHIKRRDDAGKLYGDELFTSDTRVRRRFHTEVFGLDHSKQFEGGARPLKAFPVLPDLWTSELDLDTPLQGRSIDTEFYNDDEDEE